MQTYDLLMILVLVATTMFGFWKGMAWQIASLASLVLSYFAALRFSAQLAPTFGDHAPWNRFVAMLAIYIATSFLIWMLFRLVSGMIDKVKLESFDRQLGAMFGLAKGVLLCVAITFFAVTLLPPAQGEAIVASQSGRYIVALLDKSHTVFPPEVHQVVDPYIDRIEQRLAPGSQPQGQDFQAIWPQNTASQSSGTSWPASWPQQPSSAPASSQQPPTSPPAQSWPPAQQWPPLGAGQSTNGSSSGTAPNPFSASQASAWPQPSAPQQGGQTQTIQQQAESLFSTLRQVAKPLVEDPFHASQQASLPTPYAAPQPVAPPAEPTNPYAVPHSASQPAPYGGPREPGAFPGTF